MTMEMQIPCRRKPGQNPGTRREIPRWTLEFARASAVTGVAVVAVVRMLERRPVTGDADHVRSVPQRLRRALQVPGRLPVADRTAHARLHRKVTAPAVLFLRGIPTRPVRYRSRHLMAGDAGVRGVTGLTSRPIQSCREA